MTMSQEEFDLALSYTNIKKDSLTTKAAKLCLVEGVATVFAAEKVGVERNNVYRTAAKIKAIYNRIKKEKSNTEEYEKFNSKTEACKEWRDLDVEDRICLEAFEFYVRKKSKKNYPYFKGEGIKYTAKSIAEECFNNGKEEKKFTGIIDFVVLRRAVQILNSTCSNRYPFVFHHCCDKPMEEGDIVEITYRLGMPGIVRIIGHREKSQMGLSAHDGNSSQG